jgi:DNA recombination protein RmuC
MSASMLLVFVVGGVLGAAVTAVVMLLRQGQTAAEHTRLQIDAARLGAELDSTRQSLSAQQDQLTHTQVQLRESFALLSRDALKDNRADFLHSADALLAPVRDALGKVQTHLTDVDKAREGSYQAVRAQLGSLAQSEEALRKSTESLSQALRSPNVRGKWGEIQLKRIVEMAGMLDQCDFVEKSSVTTSEGTRQTPDLVVRLPGGGSIVLDSKVPIDAFLAAANATTDSARAQHLILHGRQVREHVRSLGAKEYWKQFQPAPEFVVMFVSPEALLTTAFEQDPSLFDYAANERVIPATPMTLLALLRTIAYGWQQQRLAANAEEIQEIGRDLYDRLATMVGHLEEIGDGLKQAGDSYDRFIGSLEAKVLPGARRFKELGVSSTRDLAVPEPLGLSPRTIQREELKTPGPTKPQ